MRDLAEDRGVDEIISPFDRSDVPGEGGRCLLDWWQSARDGDRLPSRQAFNPSIMGRYLNNVALIEWRADEAEFYVRLFGTGPTAILGWDPRGAAVSSLPFFEGVRERYLWAVEKARPYLCRSIPMRWAPKDYGPYSCVAVPLSDNGRDVDKLLTHATYDIRHGHTRLY